MPYVLAGVIESENIVYKKIDWYTCSTVDGPHGPGNPPLYPEVLREMTCSAKEGAGDYAVQFPVLGLAQLTRIKLTSSFKRASLKTPG